MTNEGSQHFRQGDMRAFDNTILRMASVTTSRDLNYEGAENAAELCVADGRKVIDFAMADVSAKIHRPQPDENGIVPQFEGYFNLKHVDLAPYKASSVVGDELHVNPRLPEAWNTLAFNVTWRGQKLSVKADKQTASITNTGAEAVTVTLAGKTVSIAAGETVSAKIA